MRPSCGGEGRYFMPALRFFSARGYFLPSGL
jgi:hypothetical protein